MTARDIAIIKAVYIYRALTTSQIQRLIFDARGKVERGIVSSRCRHRLKMMFQHGYLFRDEKLFRRREGSGELIHFIDKKATPILAAAFGVSDKDIDWNRRDNNVGWMFLDHLLATNDFRIDIEIATRLNRLTLHQWLDERTLKSREMRDSVQVQGPEGQMTQVTIVPDGYFHLTGGGYDYHDLIEIDMGTETVRSSKYNRRDFARKIRGYLAYYGTGRYQERYDFHKEFDDKDTMPLRVLVVTISPRRLANLRAIAESQDGQGLFWFTTFDKVTPETVLTEPIWSVAGESEPRPLIW